MDVLYYIEYLDYFVMLKGEKDISMFGMYIILNFEEVKGKIIVILILIFLIESVV